MSQLVFEVNLQYPKELIRILIRIVNISPISAL
jgi:hypothetical protein